MTLFEEYPPVPPKQRTQQEGCCKVWDGFDKIRPHLDAWELMHGRAHRRIGFSARWLADVCGIPESASASICERGQELGWLIAGRLEGTDGPKLWVGHLPRQR